jgi:hypothetical protein
VLSTCDFSAVGGEPARFLRRGPRSNPPLWYKSPIGPRLLLNHLALSPEKPQHWEREGHEREREFLYRSTFVSDGEGGRLVRDARHRTSVWPRTAGALHWRAVGWFGRRSSTSAGRQGITTTRLSLIGDKGLYAEESWWEPLSVASPSPLYCVEPSAAS